MVTWKLAWRFLVSDPTHRAFSWIAVLTLLSMTVAVATMICVLSVLNGFETKLRDLFLNANAHILIFDASSGVKDVGALGQRVEEILGPELSGYSPFVHFETMAMRRGIASGAILRGIDALQRRKVQDLSQFVTPKDADLKMGDAEAIVGQGLLRKLELSVGDKMNILKPGEAVLVPLIIVGAYESGLRHYDDRLVVTTLKFAQQFAPLTGLEVGIHHPGRSEPLAERLQEKMPEMSVKQWQAFNQSLMETLQTERGAILVMIGFVGLVAGFNILSALFVAVTQKQRAIALLKSLGATQSTIIQIFVNQGLVYGIAGSGLGILLALIIGSTLEGIAIVELPPPYFYSKIPVDFDITTYAVVASGGLLIALLAAILPARSAAQVHPIDGLRKI